MPWIYAAIAVGSTALNWFQQNQANKQNQRANAGTGASGQATQYRPTTSGADPLLAEQDAGRPQPNQQTSQQPSQGLQNAQTALNIGSAIFGAQDAQRRMGEQARQSALSRPMGQSPTFTPTANDPRLQELIGRMGRR